MSTGRGGILMGCVNLFSSVFVDGILLAETCDTGDKTRQGDIRGVFMIALYGRKEYANKDGE